MRVIKFRGFSKQLGKWVVGSLVNKPSQFIVGEITESTQEYCNLEFWYPVETKSVGQSTRLHDKNGKEIYEGDIIKGQIETMQFIKGRVYLETEHGRHWGCMIADGPEEKQFGSWDMRQLCWGVDEYTPHCEVIGNIYENPELIGGRNGIKG